MILTFQQLSDLFIAKDVYVQYDEQLWHKEITSLRNNTIGVTI